MDHKQQIITGLTEIYIRWQEVLSRLTEEEILQPLLPSDWTIKDVVAHMWAWQQGSVARAEAALHEREPDYPAWWEVMGPDPDEDVDRTNAYLYQLNRDKPWSSVYADWKTQFQHYIDLIKQVPEQDMLQPGRFKWIGKYALADSSMGSLDHHREHMETLEAWLKEHGGGK